MGMEKKVLSVRLDEDDINALRHYAREENRTLSNLIETVFKNYLKIVQPMRQETDAASGGAASDAVPFDASYIEQKLSRVGAKIAIAAELSEKANRLSQDARSSLADAQQEISELYISLGDILRTHE